MLHKDEFCEQWAIFCPNIFAYFLKKWWKNATDFVAISMICEHVLITQAHYDY